MLYNQPVFLFFYFCNWTHLKELLFWNRGKLVAELQPSHSFFLPSGWIHLYDSQELRKENEASIQVILLMACQKMTISFGSAHYHVNHKQAELSPGNVRNNSSSWESDEWDALSVTASKDLTGGREKHGYDQGNCTPNK